MKWCFFGKKPTPEVAFLLRVLDSSDLMDLAGMYGEARDLFQDIELMKAVNKRMEEVLRNKEQPARADEQSWKERFETLNRVSAMDAFNLHATIEGLQRELKAARAGVVEWKSLTDREWVNIVNSDEVKQEGGDVHGAVCAAFKLIETKLREKNEPATTAASGGKEPS